MSVTAGSGQPDSSASVDVVIVNFNAGAFLPPCLASLANEAVGRIIVVDNDSNDDSHALVTALSVTAGNVCWLQTGSNLGFGRAANRGVAAAQSEFVLLLNPDTVVLPGAVATLAACLASSDDVGIVGPEVVNADGSRYPSARAFPDLIDAMGHGALGLVAPRNRWSARYRNPDRVDWVSGTAMLLRRSAFEQVGGFDETYFMYVEDVDLCWRLRSAGWSVRYEPSATVRHSIGGSSEQQPYAMIVAHHRSLWRFARTTTTGLRRIALPAVAVGLLLRTLASSAVRFVRKRPPAAQ